MYFDEYRFHRGPSIDDDPTLSGPGGAPNSTPQSGQTGQAGSSPRMNLNGQDRPDGQTGPGDGYRRQMDPSDARRPNGNAPVWANESPA